MAFHVACPITCRSICFCALGFPQKLQTVKGKKDFLEEVFRVEEFLTNPPCSFNNANDKSSTVQVLVPRVVTSPPPPPPVAVVDGLGGRDSYGGGDGEDHGEELLSVQSKRFALQRKAVAASLAAEDYARRFESGSLAAYGETGTDVFGDYQSSSSFKVMCRICFHGEDDGSERATRMPSCKMCNKKYHKSCLKKWAQHRDLFDWSSWVCPSCRICEICRRTGDPTKFMFCKRCDGAYHCYCQQPPHKNVSSGTYLCPKHTRCHSCWSTVHGSGLSTRWFLGYSFCDACGRLFVKGKYCPVCLKVYRDSETTPMVCCDVCERWVHCQCDGISDEKYLQFQADRYLYYKCAACRGECYQVKDVDDAIQEIWRRRDEADRDQIAALRAAAGLPSQEGISPFSDDEENGSIVPKNDYGRFSKTSFNCFIDITAKKTKESGKKSKKKYEKKKGNKVMSICKAEDHQSNERRSFKFSLGDERKDDKLSHRSERQEIYSSGVARSSGDTKENCSINQAGIMKHNFGEEIMVNNEDKSLGLVHSNSRISHGLYLGEGTGKHASKSKNVKGKKLVIHLGVRNRNVTNSPMSEASSHHKEHDLTASNGSEDTSDLDNKYRVGNQEGITKLGYGKGEKLDSADQSSSKQRDKEHSMINLGKVKSEVSYLNPKIGRGSVADRYVSTAVGKTRALLGSTGVSSNEIELDEAHLRRHSKGTPITTSEINDKNNHTTSGSDLLQKDPKPLLKLKFKNPCLNYDLWASQHEEEKGFVKGQRSKRKRPSSFLGKTPVGEGEDITPVHQDNPINEVIDANWIFEKLGKDAIGKIVEVHQPSDDSWNKGAVTDVVEGTSTIVVRLDDGRARTLELGKEGVRFVSQKQKRSRT